MTKLSFCRFLYLTFPHYFKNVFSVQLTLRAMSVAGVEPRLDTEPDGLVPGTTRGYDEDGATRPSRAPPPVTVPVAAVCAPSASPLPRVALGWRSISVSLHRNRSYDMWAGGFSVKL